MPCNSEYLEPTSKEIESKAVCEHLMYLLESSGQPIPKSVINGLADIYGNPRALNKHTRLLCKLLTQLTPMQEEDLLYNGRNGKARRLAEWWDAHQELDRKREEDALLADSRKTLIQQAKDKLTPEELEALGLT